MADKNMPEKKKIDAVATKRIKKDSPKTEILLRYAKRFFTQFGTAILAVSIVAYVFLQLMLNVGTMLDTENAAHVKISDRAEIQAFLFRDEQLVPASAKGTNCYLAEDGSKVRAGETVVVTYSNPTDVEIQNRISEIDARIAVLEQSNLSTGASATNISVLDTEIEKLMLSIVRQADENEFDKILRNKEKLLILMNRRQALIHSGSYSEELESLKAEKKTLEQSLAGASVTTTSSASGYFYSTVDGYENDFTIEKLESLTADDFDKLSESVPNKKLIEKSAGKIVTNSTWYIAVELDKRTAEGFVDGRTYPVVFQYSNNTELKMKVERRITRSDRNVTILILATKQIPADFDFSRCQTVELPHTEYEGLRVSTSAIRVKDGKQGVYVVVGTKIVFKETEVIYTYGSYSVCAIPKDPAYPSRKNIAYSSKTQLSLHDAVVINGNDIYDGMRVK